MIIILVVLISGIFVMPFATMAKDETLPISEDDTSQYSEDYEDNDDMAKDETLPISEGGTSQSSEDYEDNEDRSLNFGIEFKVGGETTPVTVDLPENEEGELPENITVAEACELSDLAEDIPELLTSEYVGWVETSGEGEELIPVAENKGDISVFGLDNDEFSIDGATPVSKENVLSTDEVKELPLEQGTVRYFSAVMPLAASATSSKIIGGENGEPLKAEIFADGRQQVWLYNTPNPGYDFINRQFVSDPAGSTSGYGASAGWILHLYDGNTRWSIGKGDDVQLSQMSQNSNYLTYNGVTLSSDRRSATVSITAKYKGSQSETIGILLTYHIDPGSRQMPVTVQIVNNTTHNFSKMNFIFAEDSYFGMSQDSIGNYNAMANMVYVRAGSSSIAGTTGIMSITGSAATPFTNWDIRDWNKINHGEFLKLDQLLHPIPNPPKNMDTVLAAGWGYNNFNVDDTINISYYEAWTPASDIQVLAPAGETVPPEARVNYEFNVINLTTKEVTISELKLKSQNGWPVKLTGGSQSIKIPVGGTATVTAELVVPPDSDATVYDGAKDNLTLTATTTNGKTASGTTTTTIDEDMPALNITKVGQTEATVTFRVDFLNYDYPHDTTVSILDIDGNVLGTALNVAPQTTENFVSGGYFTFDITKLTVNKQYMAEADARPDIPYPARTTFKIEPVHTVTFNKNATDATDPNPEAKAVITGEDYGDLAVTTRAGYKFDGWYTAATNGTQITKDTVVTLAIDHTLYAHWTATGYNFAFTKVKGFDNTTSLSGAKFNLFVCNGVPSLSGKHTHTDYDPNTVNTDNSCWVSVNDSPVVSDNNGIVDFGSVPSGTYLLREVEAPTGFERPLGWWIITIDADGTTPKITAIDGAGPLLPPAFISDSGYTNLRLPNCEKTVLPLTGATPLDLSIVAAILLGTATLIFAMSRRRKAVTTGEAAEAMVETTGKLQARNPKNIIVIKRVIIASLAAVLVVLAAFSATVTVHATSQEFGSITVHKYEAYDYSSSGSGSSADVSKLPTESRPLQGVAFTVQKVTVDHTPATHADALFTYEGKSYVYDSSGAYAKQTIETDEAGEAVFSGLPLGIYLVSEQAPATPFLVSIPTTVAGASESTLYDIHVYPKTLTEVPEEPQGPVEGGEPSITPSVPSNTGDPSVPNAPHHIYPKEQGARGGSGRAIEAQLANGDLLHHVASGLIPFGGFSVTNAWSLLSLIMSLIAIVISLILIIWRLVRRRAEDDEMEDYEGYDPEEDEMEKRNAFIARLLTIIFGILTPIVFLILDDMRLPMVWINKWTPYVGIVFIIHIALLLFYKLRNKEGEESRELAQDP
ncbi:MAG: InlB B-repeat-containing protein [Clostridiales Family XIII bacterium]|nr:InlB B-repeat-containing protein [Clostridiales Family XIII bacterium]